MIPGYSEELRLTYPLTPESVVIDAGGYKGDWAAEILRRYGCKVHVYEPVREFYARIAERFAGNRNIVLRDVGLSDRNTVAEFGIQNDSTGRFADSPDRETVLLVDVASEVGLLGPIALMKINTEGSEFGIIERLLDTGLIDRIDDIQVQWHQVAPSAESRYKALQWRLAQKRHLTFDSGWVWQNWRKNA